MAVEDALIGSFERWWHDEGSGITPSHHQDHEQHVKSVARIAWLNGADKAVSLNFSLDDIP